MKANRGQPATDATLAGKAVLNLCDLAVRCLSVDRRGQTALADDDEATLRKISDLLNRQKELYAIRSPRRKASKLTANQQALGWLRLALNDLCRYAVEVPPSDELDNTLASEMEKLFSRFRERIPVERKHIEGAIRQAKKTEKARRRAPGAPARHWLRTVSDSDNRDTMPSAAGQLLRLAVQKSGVKLEKASVSVTMTAEYAQKVLLQLHSQSVRRVTPFERLTYLMTVLGVSSDEAPWVGFQVSRLVAGDHLIGRLAGGFDLGRQGTRASQAVLRPQSKGDRRPRKGQGARTRRRWLPGRASRGSRRTTTGC